MLVCFEFSFILESLFLQLNAWELNKDEVSEFKFLLMTLIMPVILDGTSIFVIILLHRYAYNTPAKV